MTQVITQLFFPAIPLNNNFHYKDILQNRYHIIPPTFQSYKNQNDKYIHFLWFHIHLPGKMSDYLLHHPILIALQ